MEHNHGGLSRLDGDLAHRVANFLGQHFPRLRTVEVQASQGVVTIRGHVNSFYERQLCINCCQRVAGVVRLNDEVNVIRAYEKTRSLVSRPRISLAG